jgi:hypothetical protein
LRVARRPALAFLHRTCGSVLAGKNRPVRYFSRHLPLTFMFLSAKIGDLAAAQTELEVYARKYELAEDVVAKLAKLLRDLAPVENGRSQS